MEERKGGEGKVGERRLRGGEGSEGLCCSKNSFIWSWTLAN